MAAPGGRRATARVGAHVSWRERDAIATARAVESVRAGRPLGMADWLVGIVRERLAGAAADGALPATTRERARRAVAALDAEAAEERRAPGRPPVVH